MHKRLYSFLEKNSLLFEQQYGFRNKLSTNHALIAMTNRIQEACGIYVDFKKAFDTVNHKILLDKLAHYGVRGTENKWFKNYLTNSKQHVTVSGQTSDNALIESGVPQDSVLSPLLFLIYINHDLKLLTTLLIANRISLNTSKTEILLFRPKSKRNITKH